ncbi:MAG: hypothetical protein IJ511_06665 [Bacteroides sp.]|nr:hypothetical protein [Bacteroides sp.]
MALRDYLNEQGDYIAVYANVEAGQAVRYVIDLGVIVRGKPLRVANAIYKEVIPRELTWVRQQTLVQQSARYLNPDWGM